MRVFVYGSLKMGYGNHELLASSEKLGEAETAPTCTMYSLGAFPAVSMKGTTVIKGEVYEVDEATFERLDTLEGYPSFYNRSIIPTEYGDAWIYHIEDHDYSNVVEGGEW